MGFQRMIFGVKQSAIIMLVLSFQLQAMAQKRECSALLDELKAMQNAQKTLLTNMVQNNQTMATTLDDYSQKLRDSSKIKRPVTAKDITSLHQSAEAFRAHGTRESKLIAKFTNASEGLLKRVEACLVD